MRDPWTICLVVSVFRAISTLPSGSQVQAQTCTETGWFGDKCQYKCHCRDDNCDQDGNSVSGSSCVEGWFGPQCQYVDLTSTMADATTPEWLSDGADSTCNHDSTDRSVTVTLTRSLPFTWIRIHSNTSLFTADRQVIPTISTSFKQRSSDSMPYSCGNRRQAMVNDKTLDIHCELTVEVQQLTLNLNSGSWGSLCSVYISGGRNLALRQDTDQSSTFGDSPRSVSSNAVDGNTDGDWFGGSCTNTADNIGGHMPYWNLIFGSKQMINRYVVYNRQDGVSDRLLNFALDSFDENGGYVFQYQDSQTPAKFTYTITSTTKTSPVSRVQIRATYRRSNDLSPVLTLCEVETYGDSVCPAGKYGRNCEGTCNCVDSTENCFVSTGGCPSGCAPGYQGEDCHVEDASQTTCPTGKYGPTCNLDCSSGCDSNGCDKDTGSCTCKNVWFTGDTCTDCITGRYGTSCEQNCNLGCRSNVCEKATGICLHGCKDGFSSTNNCQECIAGRYGLDCSLTCPTNCNTVQCLRDTGYCTGCKSGYYGVKCENMCSQNCYGSLCNQYSGSCISGCNAGYAGEDCNTKCNENCKYDLCLRENPATCSPHGCIDGYVAPLCTDICLSGQYGPGCSLPCPVNCKTPVCHHVKGTCTDGCKDGFSGAQCTSKCPKGMYGPSCKETCSPNCEGGECASDNGHCTLGCTGNYTGDMCNIVCKGGMYGNGCSETCSQTCKDGDCHPRTGHCYECSGGYSNKSGDSMCKDECGIGTYGQQCSQNCSINCFVNVTIAGPCDHITGFCLQGCVEGYSGDLCGKKISSDNDILLPAAIGGAVAAAILVIIIIVLIVCLCRKRKRGKEERFFMAENQVINGREARKENGNVFTDPESPILPESANKTQATPPSAEGVDEEDGTPNFNDATVVSTTVTTAALAPKLLPKPKPTPKEKPKLKPKPPAKPNKLALMLKGKGGKAKKSPYYNTMISQSKTAIAVEELDSFMASKNKDFFQDQFKSIPNNETATTRDAQSDENRAKNRYKNICAYDHSRVHLKINTGKHQGDYINASYIDGYKGDEKFIASQGPMAINMEDFARMLWEQKVEKVVMLTNLVEDGKVKCERYWPEEETELEFGDIKISLLTTQVFADYTIRRIQLYIAGEESQTVTHYHFTSWPDKDVPTTPWGLVDFEQRVAAQATDKPIVVHCSAGVGRTGTFIALRNVMRQAEDTGYVDFFTTVGLQRENRVNMVQTAAQYEFLHRAAYIAIVCMGTTVTGEAIQERIAALEERSEGGKTYMEKEFKAVCAVCEEANDSGDEDDGDEVSNVYQNSRSVVNKMKNRVANILPKEYYRVRLMCTEGATEDYINAVFTPSFKRQDQQILTQDPLPTTVTDFWRMVTQYKVTLIMAFDVDTKDVDKTIGDYLPDEETEEPLDLSLCSVYVTSSTSEEFWEEQKITVTTTGKWKEKMEASGKQVEGSQQVTHVTCLTTDLDATNLLTFIKHIRSLRSDGEGRTVYMCRNGADYSGLVCVLSLLLDRLDSDQYLTVPLVVGAIKAIRPQVIPSLEQYKMLYQVLKIYNESNNVYCNFK